MPCGVEAGCPNLLTPVEPPADPVFYRRLGYLTKLESLVNVGCAFGPNDLDPRTWNELIMFAMERQRMDEKVRKAQDRKADRGKAPPEQETAFRAARKELGVPEAGASLFSSTTKRTR